MDIRNRQAIHQSARASLASAAGSPQQVVLIYTIVSGLLALASTVVSMLLSNQIAETGGLSNLGLRSILSTIQFLLPFVQALVMMGMGLGYQANMLNIVRNRPAAVPTFAEGFRRFWPLLRTMLLQYCIYFGAVMLSLYASSFIFMMLPFSEAFYEIMTPYLSTTTLMTSAPVMDDATLMAAGQAMMPMLLIFAVVSCALLVPIMYQYRMASYCLLDSPRPGAFAALRESRAMMHGNRFQLFRIDLSFWWFYLLEALITLVCYGDVLLPMVGITFPWSNTVSYFLFYILSLVLQVVVYWLFMNRVNVTYATVYETLKPRPKENGAVLGSIFDM